MGDQVVAFGRFLEKIDTLLDAIAQPNGPTDRPEWSAREIVWKEVLDAVYTVFRKTHAMGDSFRISCSAIAGVLIEGTKTDYKTLYNACESEHRGRFTSKREPATYAGDMDEMEARQADEEGESQHRQRVEDRVEGVLKKLSRSDAGLLRRRHFDGRGVTFKQLARDYKAAEGAIKMRLQRAEQKFARLYKEKYEHADRVFAHSDRDATSDATAVLQAVG
jgi:hypothetical protein